MFKLCGTLKNPKHYLKRVGREVPGVVAVLSVVNTGPRLIAVSITEMVILYKFVKIVNNDNNNKVRDKMIFSFIV